MINILSPYRKIISKIVLAFIIFFSAYFISTKIWYKYKYYKSLENRLKQTEIKIIKLENLNKILIKKGIQNSNNNNLISKQIDDNLKADEKNNINPFINNDELNDFITRHQKKR